jgi:tellurite resistance protein TerC
MALDKGEGMEPEHNPVLRLCRRFIRVTPAYHGQRFFVRLNGQLLATPLFLVFVIVNVTDVIFAVDSIPAIFAITTDPFIVYTSNVFAILGLRSLYFLLAGVVTKFHYLNLGLGIVLSFVGAKMLLADIFHIPTFISLLVVVGVIGLSILASIVWPKVEEEEREEHEVARSHEVTPSSGS